MQKKKRNLYRTQYRPAGFGVVRRVSMAFSPAALFRRRFALREPAEVKAVRPGRSVSIEQRAIRYRDLVVGLTYVGLFCLALFFEVYLRVQTKSQSLNVWTLSRRKSEMESEITRLYMRRTVLESPVRLESLASSEIGLTEVVSQNDSEGKKKE